MRNTDAMALCPVAQLLVVTAPNPLAVLLQLQAGFLRVMRPRIEKLTRDMRERSGKITGFLVETLSAMKLIQSVAGEGREAERLHGLNRDYLGGQLRLQITNYVTGAVPSVMMTLSVALKPYWIQSCHIWI